MWIRRNKKISNKNKTVWVIQNSWQSWNHWLKGMFFIRICLHGWLWNIFNWKIIYTKLLQIENVSDINAFYRRLIILLEIYIGQSYRWNKGRENACAEWNLNKWLLDKHSWLWGLAKLLHMTRVGRRT